MSGYSIGFCGGGFQFQAYKSIGQSLKEHYKDASSLFCVPRSSSSLFYWTRGGTPLKGCKHAPWNGRVCYDVGNVRVKTTISIYWS